MRQINQKQICGVIWVISGVFEMTFFGPTPYVDLAVYEDKELK